MLLNLGSQSCDKKNCDTLLPHAVFGEDADFHNQTSTYQTIDLLSMAVHSSLGLCHDNTDNKYMLVCRSLVRWQLIYIA
jgi:hypothetical protein